MIPKEELYFKFLDYVIKNHNKVTDPVKVLQRLGLDEYEPHAYEIAKELQNSGYLKTISLHKGKIAIVDYTMDAKYFVENFKRENTENKNITMSINIEQKEFTLDIFISHSSANQEVVKHFIELIVKAFKIDESKIRCTSVPGYKLPSGANVDSTLKTEIIDSKVFVGFITTESIESTYVLFELGARWGSDLGFRLINIDESLFGKLRPPLINHHINNIAERNGLYQILNELQKDLGYKQYDANAIENNVQNLIELISNLNNKKPDKEVVRGKSKGELSSYELDILKSAEGPSDGVIRIISSKDGTTIQCGTKVILDSDSNKEIQQYKSAIESLLEKQFLTAINNNGTRYEFTKKTYDYLNRV
jgi:hypothetical protein